MKISLSRIVKDILGVSISIFILMSLILCFLLSNWNTNINQEKVQLIIKEIEKSKPQNPRLLDLYDRLNGGTFKQSMPQFIGRKFLGAPGTCPCLEVTEELYSAYQKKGLENHYLIALKIERKVSQKDCKNYLFQNGDYLIPDKGVRKAAQFYFQKPIEELSDRELIGLILMKKNPSFYNPRKNQERFWMAVDKMLQTIETTDKG